MKKNNLKILSDSGYEVHAIASGNYYISEVNPRFGGAYLHAYGAGVDFIKLIVNNINKIENLPNIGDYEEGVVMMMYDSVIIKKNL